VKNRIGNNRIERITVRELTDKADVHRSTFYANFEDIYDLYNQTEDFVIKEISEILSAEHNLDARAFFSILLQYIFDNRQVCRLILTGNINSVFINRISVLFKDLCVECWKKEHNLKCSDNELDNYAQFFLSGSMGIIGEWVANGFENSIEETMLVLADIDYGFGIFIKNKSN
jgi:AcrR family transcriptional regulator